jgi:ribosomal protein S18 acetylase RimI-like enzyme
MRPEERARFVPLAAELKDGRKITIRMLAPTDGEALAEFYGSVPREDYRFYGPHPLTRAAALQKVEQGADSPTFVCAVGVEETGRIVGYAWYRWKESDSPTSVFGICIRREYQGGGTGQAILRRLLEVAREVGPERMCLTVQKANTRAVALYQKMGFEIVREQTRGAFEEFPDEPEYYMERATRG